MALPEIHSLSLAQSTALSGYYMPNVPAPGEVIAVLNDAGVNFMLIGAHGIGGWMREPRATQDVDVLVALRHHKKAVKALRATFPRLEAEELDAVTRLRDRETARVVIDVMKPNQQLYRVALKHTHLVQAGGQSFKIPSLEMALAMKFAPMISPHRRDADKYQDAHDFILMVEANPDIDLAKLADLGNLVYPAGGAELVEKVRQVRAGERLNL
jgi:hypothetical protein